MPAAYVTILNWRDRFPSQADNVFMPVYCSICQFMTFSHDVAMQAGSNPASSAHVKTGKLDDGSIAVELMVAPVQDSFAEDFRPQQQLFVAGEKTVSTTCPSCPQALCFIGLHMHQKQLWHDLPVKVHC